jgi:hypothetical protein
MTFLSRLNFTFDTAKFGTATDPDGKLKNKLAEKPAVLTTSTSTSYSLAVASNTANATYYKNPVASLCSSISAKVTSVYNLVYNACYAQVSYDPDTGAQTTTLVYLYRSSALTDNYNACIQELTTADSNGNHNPLSYNTFISHTNRLSNLDYSNKANRPDYNGGLNACKTVQTVVYQTEKGLTTDAVIAGLGLGCFTSLFISSDLNTHLSTLNSLYATANSLFATQPIATMPDGSSYTPSAAMNTCNTNVVNEFISLLSLLQTTRTNDENFYIAANSINTDVGKVNQLVNSVTSNNFTDPAQVNLLENYIGTTSLKNLKPT